MNLKSLFVHDVRSDLHFFPEDFVLCSQCIRQILLSHHTQLHLGYVLSSHMQWNFFSPTSLLRYYYVRSSGVMEKAMETIQTLKCGSQCKKRDEPRAGRPLGNTIN